MSNRAIAVSDQEAGNFLQGLSATLETYAVRTYNPTSFTKSAMIAIVSNDDLKECLNSQAGKESLTNTLKMAAGTGLSLNPMEMKAAIIPRNKKIGDKWVKVATYQVMKGGMIELAHESGKVDFITSETVRSADEFAISKTMDGDQYNFSPARKARGDIDGFFAAVKMKDGKCHVRYMTLEETDAHRQKFSEKTSMPVEGYGEKTVLKRLLKNLHISSDMDNATGADSHEPEERDITPVVEKGTSSDELTEKLEVKQTESFAAETKPEIETAEVVEEPAKKREPVI